MVSSSAGREAANAPELTFGEAKKIVQRVEDLFGKADLPNIIRGFTTDAPRALPGNATIVSKSICAW